MRGEVDGGSGLLRGLRERSNMTVILITHDMGVIAQMCDRVGVMYAGELVEVANVQEIFTRPGHPYTEALFGAIPSARRHGQPLQTIPGQVPDLFLFIIRKPRDKRRRRPLIFPVSLAFTPYRLLLGSRNPTDPKQ